MQEYFQFILQWRENEPVLGGFAPPATGRTPAVFSMVLDLFLPKHCVHKDTARYILSNSKPFGLLSKILVLIWKICFEITHLLNMSHKLGHLSRIFAAEIKNNCIMTLKELLDSLSFDEIAPFLIRHYHTIMRQEIWLLKSQLAACGIHHFGATYPTSVKNLSEKSPQII